MNEDVMTEEEFASFINWEGGVIAALEYGLKPEQCESGVLRDAYEKVYEMWSLHGFGKAVSDLENLLGE